MIFLPGKPPTDGGWRERGVESVELEEDCDLIAVEGRCVDTVEPWLCWSSRTGSSRLSFCGRLRQSSDLAGTCGGESDSCFCCSWLCASEADLGLIGPVLSLGGTGGRLRSTLDWNEFDLKSDAGVCRPLLSRLAGEVSRLDADGVGSWLLPEDAVGESNGREYAEIRLEMDSVGEGSAWGESLELSPGLSTPTGRLGMAIFCGAGAASLSEESCFGGGSGRSSWPLAGDEGDGDDGDEFKA